MSGSQFWPEAVDAFLSIPRDRLGGHQGADLRKLRPLMTRRTPLLRATLAALAVLVALVAVLGMWQVVAARDSQRAQIGNGELTAARLASSAVSNAVTSRLDTLDNLANLSGSANFVATNSAPVISATIDELLKLTRSSRACRIIGAQRHRHRERAGVARRPEACSAAPAVVRRGARARGAPASLIPSRNRPAAWPSSWRRRCAAAPPGRCWAW